MGVLTKSDWVMACVAIAVLGSASNGLVLHFLLKFTKVTKTRSLSSRITFVEETGPCARFFKRPDSFQLSKNFSVVSVALFFVSSFVSVFNESLYFCLCHDCGVRKALWIFMALCAMFGYILTYAAHFERLRLTFSGTPMQLPKWAPKLMYGTCLLFVSLMPGVVLLRHSQPKVASMLIVFGMVLYFGGVSFLTRIFFKKTTAIANSTPPDTALLEVAVRVTVVVTVSMLSTVVMWLSVSLLFAACPMCFVWLTLGRLLFVADQCLNSFCLMCVFSGAAVPYQRVFGRLHSLLLSHVSKTLDKSTMDVRAVNLTAVASFSDMETTNDKSLEQTI